MLCNSTGVQREDYYNYGHVLLNMFLQKIKATDSALCLHSASPETVSHYWLHCCRGTTSEGRCITKWEWPPHLCCSCSAKQRSSLILCATSLTPGELKSTMMLAQAAKSSCNSVDLSHLTRLTCCLYLVLGKFSPRPIGTRSGLDQTLWSRSRSGIFPKTWESLVSSPGIPILPETVSDPVWTGTA